MECWFKAKQQLLTKLFVRVEKNRFRLEKVFVGEAKSKTKIMQIVDDDDVSDDDDDDDAN